MKALHLSFFLIFLAAGTQAAPPALKISGNQIVTASGNCPVRLYGVDYSGLEFSPGGEGPGTTVVDGVTMSNVVAGITAATSGANGWRGNCVRLPLNQDFWFGIENSAASGHGYGSVSQQAYRDMVLNVVNYCNSNNIYVDLDLHWSGTSTVTTPTAAVAGSNGWGTSTGQQPMPDWNCITFWQSVASTAGIQNNPAVIFDMYNEPYSPSGVSDTTFWPTWRNGGAAGSLNTPGLQTILNYIRGAGANNIVIAGGLQWAYNLQGVPGYALSDTGSGNGVLYSAHVYSNKGTNTSTWDSYVTTITNTYPVIVEEFGASATDGAAFDTTLINWINGANSRSTVYSAMAWAFSPDVGPTLLTSWTNFPPTSYHGVPVQNWQATLATTPTVACGNASPTATPSATRSATSTATRSPTPSATVSPSSSPSLSPTPSLTASFTPSASPTSTASRTPSFTPTSTRSFTPSDTTTASPTASPSLTASFTPTHSTTASPTMTISETFTSVPPGSTQTDTPTLSPSFSATPSESATPTTTETATPSDTATNTPTLTSAPTPGASASPTSTFSPTATPSPTPTASGSASPTPSPTATASLTPSDTPTATATNAASATLGTTASPSASATAAGLDVPIGPGYPVPNPQAGPVFNIVVRLPWLASKVETRIYTQSLRLVASADSGPYAQGWARIKVLAPGGLAAGAYYVVSYAWQGDFKSAPTSSKLFVLPK